MRENVKKKVAKRKFLLETTMIIFIAASPFLYKLYDYIPESAVESYTILGITISNHGFTDVTTFLWFLTGKIVPLYLLIFWFLSVKNWWYHIILIPIAMYTFQIFEVLYSFDQDIDTQNLMWLLPICMVIIPFVYFIRIKLYDKHVHGIDLEAMDAELKELKEKPGPKIAKSVQKIEEDEVLDEINIPSVSEQINTKLSTGNIENVLKNVQHKVEDWLHVKL